MTRGECGNWHPGFVWLYVMSNVLIAASYFIIPFVIGIAIWRARDGRAPQINITQGQARLMRYSFAGFILFCGLGHLLDGVMSFFYPRYHLVAVWHAMTAVASWFAVFAVAKMRHRIIPGV